jgi:hypothetical protein
MVQRHGRDHCIDRVGLEATEVGDAAGREVDVGQAQCIDMLARPVEHGGGQVKAGEAAIQVESGDLGELRRRAARQVEDVIARPDRLADVEGVEQIDRRHDAVDAASAGVGGDLRRIVHDEIGLDRPGSIPAAGDLLSQQHLGDRKSLHAADL